MDQVKQQASTRVNEQKARAAEGLGSVASAIRQASEHLRTENQTLATYADKAVDQIQLFADRMRDKDPAEMVRDAERFARRNPTAFVGGAFVLGLALARFLKSSGEAQYGDHGLVHRDSDFGDTGITRSGAGYGSSYGSYGSGPSSGRRHPDRSRTGHHELTRDVHGRNLMDTPRPERSLGDLFADLSQQTSLLIRQEVQLARTELSQKATQAGRAGAMLGAGGAVVNAALLTFTATIVLLLVQLGLDAWAAAGLTAVLLAAVGYVLVRSGLRKLRQPMAPVETIDSIKETAQWLKNETR